MATRIMVGNVRGNVIVHSAFSEDPGAGIASTGVITKAMIEAGNNFLVVVTDEAVYVDIGATPDGSAEQYLAVPAYPLIIALNSAHYDMKVAYAVAA